MSEKKLRVRTIYRQNFLLTTGVVLLTLVLLGVSFFALSYSYTRNARAAAVSRTCRSVASWKFGARRSRLCSSVFSAMPTRS